MAKCTNDQLFLSALSIEDGGCWKYPNTPNHDGYIRVSVKGRKVMTHRYSLMLRAVFIPVDCEVDHLCRNRWCCNPDHLQIVTHAENMRRGTGMDRIHAVKTHCVNGHEFTTESTYRNPRGFRNCKVCRRIHDKNRKPRREP